MTALDWATLRGLIDAGDLAGVTGALADLQERQRRELGGQVRAYARALRNDFPRDWARDWEHWRRRTVALRTAGAGCLSGAGAVAQWLSRRDLQAWRGDDEQTVASVLEVLRARGVPWLDDLARRLADRLRVDRWDASRWSLVAALVTVTGIQPPTSDGFVFGWAWHLSVRPPDRQGLPEVLRRDRFLMALAPRLFEVDGIGQLFTWSGSNTASAWTSWPAALARLAAEGHLERAMLLDRCLGRLLRGGRPTELRGFLLLHQALDPGVDEVAARVRDYARLLPDAPAPVATLAQRELRRLDDAGRLDPDVLLEASRAVLFREEKQLVRAQLAWLDALARRRGDLAGQVVGATAVAFGQQAADLQQRALSLALRHARRADDAARAELLRAASALPVDLRRRAAEALGGAAPAGQPAADPRPMVVAPPPRSLPPPIGSPAELAEELAALLDTLVASRSWVDPVALERVLAALVTFAHSDRATLRHALDPVLRRHHIQPAARSWEGLPDGYYFAPSEHMELCWALGAAVAEPESGWRALRGLRSLLSGPTPGERRWQDAVTRLPGPQRAMLYRLHELAAGLTHAPVPRLLAPPTTPAGHVDPVELVGRLERAASEGWQPWAYDLEQALLRLPRQADATAARRARRLGTPAGTRLADWLDAAGTTDPRVTRVTRVLRRPRYPWQAAGRAAVVESTRVLATVSPPPAQTPTGRDLAARPALASVVFDLSAPEHWAHGYYSTAWLACWPAVLPSHRDVIAAHLLPHLTRESREGGQALALLADSDGPTGPGLTLALAYGLGAGDQSDRAAAVDAVIALAGRRQLDGDALGREIGELAALGLVTLQRIAPALRDIACSGAGAEVWAIIAAALPRLLPAAGQRPPQRLADLLALGSEVAGTIDARQPIPELAAVAARRGSSRLIGESRRLQHLLTTAP
jgi:Family of unknown function (DUF6493)